MNAVALMAHEARAELRAGLRSGIVGLVFLGLAGYLLMSLTNADYVQKMGAADIPRNAPSLVYLMSTGCMFFLFFAWAWVFAQPLLRDRQASLHEIVLSMPNSLQALLWGRFIGAAMVGALLAGALIVGFIATPLLGWIGLVPASSITAPPWRALLFAWVWLLIPAGTGIGALYYLATLRTRSVAGAFGLSALLMLLWMFAVVVLKGGHINPTLAAALDPSLFTYAQTQIETWTPLQKTRDLLPLTPQFLLNRVLWGAAPLLLLYWALRGAKRESMVLERPSRRRAAKSAPAHAQAQAASQRGPAPGAIGTPNWWSALWLETRWQLAQIVRGRGWWTAVAVLLAMGVLSAFVHGVWHAEGPMLPRPDMLLPLLKSAVFLVIAFIVAAMVGLISRRDHVEGFDGMFDATPAPAWLRPFARALAAIAATLGLAMLPGLSALLATAVAAPAALDLRDPLLYQTLIMAPPLIELAVLVFLVHALCRRSGVAYTLSMLLTFFFVLNHELGLVDHPLYEFGIPAHMNLSALTGWAPWWDYLLTLDGYKLSLSALLVALAALIVPRGVDSRWHRGMAQARARVRGPAGALAALALVAMLGLGALLQTRLSERGGYQPLAERQREDAEWERSWLGRAGAYAVAGGDLRLQADPASATVHGEWDLRGVHAAGGVLHAELPAGFALAQAAVEGREVKADIRHDHLALPLGECGRSAPGCAVRLRWTVAPPVWSSEGDTPWLSRAGVWLRAQDAAPRLGLDPQRVLRSPADRTRHRLRADPVLPTASVAVAADAIAPAGQWSWSVRVAGEQTEIAHGRGDGPLAFAAQWSADAVTSRSGNLRIVHDHSRIDSASGIVADVENMQACVARRLGRAGQVDTVVQWPRGLGEPGLFDRTLVLPEEPSWDVADAGVGRYLRRARIATALARRQLATDADLREGAGAVWLQEGAAGAVGLLCVGDEDGLAAMDQVLVREADRTAQALAASEAPVGAVSQAPAAGWAQRYAPLATLEWAAQQTPQDFAALTHALAASKPLEAALSERSGERSAVALLGPPLASELSRVSDANGTRVEGRRWRWRDGGWTPVDDAVARYRLLVRRDGVIGLLPEAATYPRFPRDSDGLLLDAWPSYQRAPQQALLRPNAAH
ncbi:ABC transporter permease [Pseudomonas sp. CGJS7]|uniref:ABC transporter permease n=1 Tax=Pseudomonas sp. CGJS7 TaxID=3109348 RepID=UPI00300BECE2